MADYGRVSGVVAEPAITPPSGDAVGRASGVIAEAAITPPSGDAVGRASGVIAEVALQESASDMRAAFVFCEVFSQAPTASAPNPPAIEGGVQGQRVLTLRKK